MSVTQEILAGIPVDSLAEQLGATPEETEAAVAAVVPALLGGMEANVQHPGGQASLLGALEQHTDATASPGSVDTADGEKIAAHIFGDQQDAVVNQLGGLQGTSDELVRKLIPILAPIVLAYLSKKVLGGAGQASAPAGSAGSPADVLTQILSGVLGGGAAAPAPAPAPAPQASGPNWGQILGGLLGRGTKG